ncbi:enoyl-ACP reductase FabI [Oceanibium sediminis]|uniref:enoyl-ACP reductase FabI n=1 Tax=Oceanibium sediminis TaxID=2026339 RepID=UPI000DD4818E|nr:enoyl-ACP reductase [Oceanibium sediminis]
MAELMQGKRGLIMGVANEKSIAWGIARALHAEGAEMAFTYQGDAFGQRVKPLAESIGAKLVLPADVQDEASLDALFATLSEEWGGLDFVVHAIAFSDKSELSGRFVNTSRANFLNSMDISCYSLVDITRRAAPMMKQGGSILTLSYIGAQRVTPNYNVMGVAKAALESAVRYLANDLGPDGVRVNAISAGPMRTLAGAAIGGARRVFKNAEQNAPLRMNASLEHVGGTAVYLLSDMGAGTTGEVIFVDGGYHITGAPQVENL